MINAMDQLQASSRCCEMLSQGTGHGQFEVASSIPGMAGGYGYQVKVLHSSSYDRSTVYTSYFIIHVPGVVQFEEYRYHGIFELGLLFDTIRRYNIYPLTSGFSSV